MPARSLRAAALALWALAVSASAPACSSAEGPEHAAVRAAFGAYRTALAARDGDAAAALVTPDAHVYYGELVALARHADAPALGRERLVDRLGALCLRAAFDREALARFDGRAALAAAVRAGFPGVEGQGGAPTLGLGPLTVEGDAAHAPLTLDGAEAPVSVQFSRVAGQWRLSLASLLTAVDDQLDGLPRQLGQPVDRWLEAAVSEAVGRPVGPELWTPPEPRPVAPGPTP